MAADGPLLTSEVGARSASSFAAAGTLLVVLGEWGARLSTRFKALD